MRARQHMAYTPEPEPGAPSLLKCFVKNLATGSSLTRLSMPASVCRPQSALQTLAHRRLRGAPYLEGVWQHDDPFLRMVAVLRWYLAAFSAKEDSKKPFNPVLGETYQCTADGVWAVLEQVSHHPPVTAYFLLDSSRRACFFGQAEMRPHFSGNSIAVDMTGPSRLVLGVRKSTTAEDRGRAREDESRAEGLGEAEEEEKGEGEWWRAYECYEFVPQTPTQAVRGVLWGRQRLVYKGHVTISCSRTGFVAHLRFCEEGPNGEPDFVVGDIYHEGEHVLVARVHGQWNGIIEIHPAPEALKGLSNASLQAGVLFRVSHTSDPQVTELVDSRQQGRDSSSVWREVCEALRREDFDVADDLKRQIEQRQREMLETEHVLHPFAAPGKAGAKKGRMKRALRKLKKGRETGSEEEDSPSGDEDDNHQEAVWRLRHPSIFFEQCISSTTHEMEWRIRWNQAHTLAEGENH